MNWFCKKLSYNKLHLNLIDKTAIPNNKDFVFHRKRMGLCV